MEKLTRVTEGFEFLSEEEITPERLSTLFNLAYLPATIDEDNDVIVRDQYNVCVGVNDRAKVLWYRIYLEEITDIPLEIVASAIVHANDRVILADLQLAENVLYSDTFLDYRSGLAAHTIVFTLRRLMNATDTLLSVLRESLDAYHQEHPEDGNG
ncbi:hypothetical protein ACSSZE_18450 [Acidithiobacillus caldus]